MASLSQPLVHGRPPEPTRSRGEAAANDGAIHHIASPDPDAPQAREIDATITAMHALLSAARPQSSAEALTLLRLHFPQVSLTNRVAAIATVLRF
jgi:hypothetical protein